KQQPQQYNMKFVDFQGFQHKNSDFLCKEIAIYDGKSRKLNHHLLTAPLPYQYLSSEYKGQALWLTANLHGLEWCNNNGGNQLPYIHSSLSSILLHKKWCHFHHHHHPPPPQPQQEEEEYCCCCSITAEPPSPAPSPPVPSPTPDDEQSMDVDEGVAGLTPPPWLDRFTSTIRRLPLIDEQRRTLAPQANYLVVLPEPAWDVVSVEHPFEADVLPGRSPREQHGLHRHQDDEARRGYAPPPGVYQQGWNGSGTGAATQGRPGNSELMSCASSVYRDGTDLELDFEDDFTEVPASRKRRREVTPEEPLPASTANRFSPLKSRLKTNILPLSDVSESSLTNCTKTFDNLDPENYFKLPSYAWDARRWFAKVRLELLTDIDLICMIENSIRGGPCQVVKQRSQ
ncbi:hypothetical protein ILUMI_17271, partial [Ignelater luminosus]